MSLRRSAEAEVRRLYDVSSQRPLLPTEREQFVAALQADPAARRLYRDILKIEAILQWELSATEPSAAVDLEQAPPTAAFDPAGVPVIGKFLVTLGRIVPGGDIFVGGLVLLAVFGALWGVVSYIRRDRPVEVAVASPSPFPSLRSGAKVGAIRSGALAVWSSDAPAPKRNEICVGERCRLAAGRVEIELDHGTQLVIGAPADWTIDAEQRLVIDAGQVVAYVPPAARGFTVVTPTAEIVDLGTKFVVEVTDASATRLAVNRGSVRLTAREPHPDPAVAVAQRSTQPARLVTAGQAVTVSRSHDQRLVVESSGYDDSWVAGLAQMGESLAITPDEAIAFQVLLVDPVGKYPNGPDTVGLDFSVSRPIEIFNLGVFDHLSDGIDPASQLTVQLWSRDEQGTPEERANDTAGKVLAERSFTASDPGVLKAGYRFKALPRSLILEPGAYTLAAYGFAGSNKCFSSDRFDHAPDDQKGVRGVAQIDTCRYAIVPTGSRFSDPDPKPGEFPRPYIHPASIIYFAGSFTFTPLGD